MTTTRPSLGPPLPDDAALVVLIDLAQRGYRDTVLESAGSSPDWRQLAAAGYQARSRDPRGMFLAPRRIEALLTAHPDPRQEDSSELAFVLGFLLADVDAGGTAPPTLQRAHLHLARDRKDRRLRARRALKLVAGYGVALTIVVALVIAV